MDATLCVLLDQLERQPHVGPPAAQDDKPAHGVRALRTPLQVVTNRGGPALQVHFRPPVLCHHYRASLR
jgi:hypothetical protein